MNAQNKVNLKNETFKFIPLVDMYVSSNVCNNTFFYLYV